MNKSRHESALLSATARRWPMIEESNAGGCISARFVGVLTAVGMDSAGVAAKGAAAAASGAGRRDAEGRYSSTRFPSMLGVLGETLGARVLAVAL
jgi:hypothetical protein